MLRAVVSDAAATVAGAAAPASGILAEAVVATVVATVSLSTAASAHVVCAFALLPSPLPLLLTAVLAELLGAPSAAWLGPALNSTSFTVVVAFGNTPVVATGAAFT